MVERADQSIGEKALGGFESLKFGDSRRDDATSGSQSIDDHERINQLDDQIRTEFLMVVADRFKTAGERFIRFIGRTERTASIHEVGKAEAMYEQEFEDDLSNIPELKIPTNGGNPPPFDFAVSAKDISRIAAKPPKAEPISEDDKHLGIGSIDDFDYIIEANSSAAGLKVMNREGFVSLRYRPRLRDMMFASSVGSIKARREYAGYRIERSFEAAEADRATRPRQSAQQTFENIKNMASYLLEKTDDNPGNDDSDEFGDIDDMREVEFKNLRADQPAPLANDGVAVRAVTSTEEVDRKSQPSLYDGAKSVHQILSEKRTQADVDENAGSYVTQSSARLIPLVLSFVLIGLLLIWVV